MGYFNGPKIVTDGLRFCLDAGNRKSYPSTGTAWNDLSNNDITGTLTNSPTFNSANGGSIVFDGVDDYINMGSNISLAQNFTLEMWCYITGDSAGLFGQGTYATSQGLHILWNAYNNRGMIFGMYSNDLDTPGYNLTFNTWHQFCFTYNHSTYLKQFYADGILINSGVGSAWSGSGQFNVGMIYSSPGNTTMKGRISIAKMYTSVLTPFQVQQNYNATKSRFGL